MYYSTQLLLISCPAIIMIIIIIRRERAPKIIVVKNEDNFIHQRLILNVWSEWVWQRCKLSVVQAFVHALFHAGLYHRVQTHPRNLRLISEEIPQSFLKSVYQSCAHGL